jgi:hypothetical protein
LAVPVDEVYEHREDAAAMCCSSVYEMERMRG